MPSTITINTASAVPKYRQIVNCILRGIEQRVIGLEEQLPSINEVSAMHEVSRDTVEKAYKVLKRQGVILSVRGKGYFTAVSTQAQERKMLLVFNKLSAYKKLIYDGFVRTIGDAASVDLQVYHNDYRLFERIIRERTGKYTDYVVMPCFKGEAELRARRLLNDCVPAGQLFLLNNHMDGLKNLRGEVYQNFETDLYQALLEARPLLQKYAALRLLFPNGDNYSRGIIRGFQRYCQETRTPNRILFKGVGQEPLQCNTAYIVVKDDDLGELVKAMKACDCPPAERIGILAYNDSPLKEVLLSGITVISTDHYHMGATAANALLQKREVITENPFRLIRRGSL